MVISFTMSLWVLYTKSILWRLIKWVIEFHAPSFFPCDLMKIITTNIIVLKPQTHQPPLSAEHADNRKHGHT